MNIRGSYSGIESYITVNRYKKKKMKMRGIFFIALVSIIICFMVIKNLVTKDTINLSDERIIYYIDETDKVSEGSLQLSWQEIAAIDLALNSGEVEVSNDEEVKKISESFFKYDKENNISGIKNFKDVIEELGLKTKEKEEANKYLIKIENNLLNRELVKDSSKKRFISNIVEDAKKSYEEYGILPSVTIAQAILESAWGESTLSSEHNNLFGIKADERWDGEKVNMKTKENYEDEIHDYFRVYKSYESSVEDHGKFLSENSRYRDNGIFDKKTYKGQAQALEDAGYATAKNEEGELIYADLLINVIKNNNLMLYDTEVQR